MSATVKRHPLKGLLGGLLLGIGLSLLAMLYGGVVVGSPTALAIVVAGIVVGVASSFVLPARKPKGAAAQPS